MPKAGVEALDVGLFGWFLTDLHQRVVLFSNAETETKPNTNYRFRTENEKKRGGGLISVPLCLFSKTHLFYPALIAS
jgi:hypothetical protein